MNRSLQLLLLIALSFQMGYSQVANNMCEGALPFCTGTSYTFPAGTGTPSAQVGPSYNCLTTQPNPAWYYMKIANGGMIRITMHSEPAHDIDFCLWGPFDTQNSCGLLTASKVVDCSYSTAATEVVDIANAVAGKYYILLITNYSNQPCNIIFSQTAGTGTTDCSILPPPAGNDGPLCVGETLHLVAANMNNAVYHWFGPGGWTSTVQNPTRPNVTLAMAGVYSLFVTVNGQPSADTNHTTVQIFNKPTATLSGGGAICLGDSIQLSLACQNHPPWTVKISPNGQAPVTIPVTQPTISFYVKPTVTTTYTVASVSNDVCTGIGTGTAVVTVNPKPLANFSFTNNCSGYATNFLDASTIVGGTVSGWHWAFGVAGDTSNIQNPSYTYMNGGTYNVLLRVISNSGCESKVIKPVVINPTPVANAGVDKSIPYGTFTTLQGSATGGSNSYSYHWEPANLLVNANIANPVTVNLSATTDYTLTVTDLGNSCQKTDVTTVTITGGPMGVQLSAEPNAICRGASTTINSQAGGGAGNYTYAWTSTPVGFSSTLEDITVQPDVTTTYNLVITDGFSTLSKTITITVYPDPVVSAGAPQTIPNGTPTVLNGSASSGIGPYSYSWSPANQLVSPGSNTTATNLLSTTTNFTLTVTDGHGCVSTGDVLITITGGPLAASPQATKSPICFGESTSLHPRSEGGSGNYTYNWSANGVTFSTSSDPEVSPQSTTTYHLVVSDGYTTNSMGYVTVSVNPLPIVNLIPAGAHIFNTDTILACAFDTLTLSSINNNSSYLWSNGATTPEVICTTTGMAYDILSYELEITNSLTGCMNSGRITVIFTFSDCSYGLPDGEDASTIQVFPNPTDGLFYCRINTNQDDLMAEVINIQGKSVKTDVFRMLSKTSETFTLDLSDQPSGIYFLKLFNNKFLRIVRIVKL